MASGANAHKPANPRPPTIIVRPAVRSTDCRKAESRNVGGGSPSGVFGILLATAAKPRPQSTMPPRNVVSVLISPLRTVKLTDHGSAGLSTSPRQSSYRPAPDGFRACTQNAQRAAAQ